MANKTVCDVCGKDVERFENRSHHPIRKQWLTKDENGTAITVLVEVKAGIGELNKGDLCTTCSESAVKLGQELKPSNDLMVTMEALDGAAKDIINS